MKHKINDYILLFFFLGLLCFFTIWIWTKEDLSSSVLENRALAQRPDATVDSVISGKYTKRFETYYNDQFPARERFVEANSKINKYLLGQNVVRDVYVHKDGYLISPVPKFTEDRAKEVAARINAFAASSNKLGVKTYFVLMPNKSTIMEDKFPDYFPSYGRQDTQLLMKQIDPAANPISPLETVNKHIKEENMYYYTDHHWKAKGAFYAYQYVINKIAKDANGIAKARKLEDYSWTESGKEFYGSDARKTTAAFVKHPDTITVAKPKFSEKPLDVCYNGKCGQSFYTEKFLTAPDLYTNRYAAYMGGDHPESVVKNPNVKDKTQRLLIIKDSYANPTIQFFSRHFSETRVLDLRHYSKMTVNEYIKRNKIKYVMITHNVNSIYVTPSLTNYNDPGNGENQ
ncbi:DHHW family protein [Actinomycetes bacterium NPDC127524]